MCSQIELRSERTACTISHPERRAGFHSSPLPSPPRTTEADPEVPEWLPSCRLCFGVNKYAQMPPLVCERV